MMLNEVLRNATSQDQHWIIVGEDDTGTHYVFCANQLGFVGIDPAFRDHESSILVFNPEQDHIARELADHLNFEFSDPCGIPFSFIAAEACEAHFILWSGPRAVTKEQPELREVYTVPLKDVKATLSGWRIEPNSSPDGLNERLQKFIEENIETNPGLVGRVLHDMSTPIWPIDAAADIVRETMQTSFPHNMGPPYPENSAGSCDYDDMYRALSLFAPDTKFFYGDEFPQGHINMTILREIIRRVNDHFQRIIEEDPGLFQDLYRFYAGVYDWPTG
jgi:hypothetical protein